MQNLRIFLVGRGRFCRTQHIPVSILRYNAQGVATTLLLAIICLLLWSHDALALDTEFYTYNGFLPVLTAFKKIALIFSDNGYKMLFVSVVILSILLGDTTTFGRMFMGRNQGPALTWVWPIGMGVVFYLGIVVHTGSLTIYDPVINKAEKVPDIPDAVVAVAGITNLVERGIIDIIHTSQDVKSYKNYAGGIGFDLLHKACTGGAQLGDNNLQTSLRNYFRECVFFELRRPGTTLTVDELVHGEIS